jgi:hypothetical protein
LKIKKSLAKENYNLMEENNLFEELEVDGDSFCWVEMASYLVWGVVGVGNLCYY